MKNLQRGGLYRHCEVFKHNYEYWKHEYWSQLRTVITKLEIVNGSFGRFSIRLLQFAAVLNVTTFSPQLFFSVKLAYFSFLSPPSYFIQQC